MSETDQKNQWFEYIHSAAVKVLKWNNKLVNVPKTIIIFRLHHNLVEVKKQPINLEEARRLGLPFTGLQLAPANTDAFPFFYNSNDPVSFKNEFDNLISSKNFFHQENCRRISSMVFENFHSCFNCNFTTVNNSTSPKIVFVIEIYRTVVHIDLPNGLEIKDPTMIDNNDVGLRESVEDHLVMVQDKAFSEDDLQNILWTLCHRVKIAEGYLVSAKTHADTIDGLSQVMAPIRMFKFEEEYHDAENQCAICWEQFCKQQLIAQMPCSHLFHKRCAFMWLVNRHSSCPLCRSACKTSIFS